MEIFQRPLSLACQEERKFGGRLGRTVKTQYPIIREYTLDEMTYKLYLARKHLQSYM